MSAFSGCWRAHSGICLTFLKNRAEKALNRCRRDTQGSRTSSRPRKPTRVGDAEASAMDMDQKDGATPAAETRRGGFVSPSPADSEAACDAGGVVWEAGVKPDEQKDERKGKRGRGDTAVDERGPSGDGGAEDAVVEHAGKEEVKWGGGVGEQKGQKAAKKRGKVGGGTPAMEEERMKEEGEALEDDGATVDKEDAGCDSGDWENDGNEARGKKRKKTLEEEDKDGCVEDDMVAAGVLPEIDPNRPLPRWAVDAASDEITEEEKLAVPEFFCGRYIVVIASRSCICMCMSCRMRICALWMFTQARCLPQAGPSIYAHK